MVNDMEYIPRVFIHYRNAAEKQLLGIVFNLLLYLDYLEDYNAR